MKITLKDEIDYAIKERQKEIEKFTIKFQESPAHALSWSDEIFRKAAELEILTYIGPVVEKHGLSEAIRLASDKIFHGAKYPSHSTSQASNLIEECRTAAWVQAHELLIRFQKHEFAKEAAE